MLNLRLRIFVLVAISAMLVFGNETVAQERNSNWKIIPASYTSPSAVAEPLIFKTNFNKVQISWQGYANNDLSHYILEHSNDGKNFRQLAVFFTEDNNDAKEYEFNFAVPDKTFYYRLVRVNKTNREDRSVIQTYSTAKK